MHRAEDSGFTLIELLTVVTIMGLVLLFSIPALRDSGGRHAVHGAIDDIVAQIRLARSTAMATDTERPLHFSEDSLGWDYHVHAPDGRITGWSLPKGVHLSLAADSSTGLVLLPSGRARQSLDLRVVDAAGHADSVTVELSGFVLAH